MDGQSTWGGGGGCSADQDHIISQINTIQPAEEDIPIDCNTPTREERLNGQLDIFKMEKQHDQKKHY